MDNSKIMALDVGSKRIGVAMASNISKLPQPYVTLPADGAIDKIVSYVDSEYISEIVIGVPRNLSGQDTMQTEYTRNFIKNLSSHIRIPIHEQDEAVTSAQAESELKKRGKPYDKEDIDSLAATYILEDFLNTRRDNA